MNLFSDIIRLSASSFVGDDAEGAMVVVVVDEAINGSKGKATVGALVSFDGRKDDDGVVVATTRGFVLSSSWAAATNCFC